MSLVSSMNIAQQALSVNQAAITTVSNNIANVDTDGYSKLRVNQATIVNYTPSAGNAVSLAESCSGVTLDSITRYSDTYLQSYYWQENSGYSYYDEYSSIAANIEDLTNELNDTGLSDALSNFYTAIDGLNDDPSDITARQNYISAAENVCLVFNNYSSNLTDVKESLVGDGTSLESSEIKSEVDNVNDLLDQIADVNYSIIKTNSGDSSSPALLDQRDALITKLTSLIPISTEENPNGTMNVSLGDYDLVKGNAVSNYIRVEASTDKANPAIISIVNNKGTEIDSNINSTITSGSIGAILDACGTNSAKFTISGVLDNIDNLASNFASIMNTIQNGNPSADGTTAMCINKSSKTLIKANENIFKSSVTGAAITAGNITVNSNVSSDPYLIAAARLDLTKYTAASQYQSDIGNNSNTTLLLASRSKTYDGLDDLTIEGNLSSTVSAVGSDVDNINSNSENQTLVLNQIKTNLKSANGVNLDEELVDLMKYQRAYQAASRVFSICNELLDDLVNLGK